MPWQMVPGKRLSELARISAGVFADWSPADAFLVGTWLAASARSQLQS